ncbi:hypothetical protein BaRGS_00029995 [Batillaria attramentaria]|uniref:Uncharacterized protein n=1 Tax=Batillaria attramentaria TaxID=370345 RepID=A0ABD0JVN3_9CAEN
MQRELLTGLLKATIHSRFSHFVSHLNCRPHNRTDPSPFTVVFRTTGSDWLPRFQKAAALRRAKHERISFAFHAQCISNREHPYCDVSHSRRKPYTRDSLAARTRLYSYAISAARDDGNVLTIYGRLNGPFRLLSAYVATFLPGGARKAEDEILSASVEQLSQELGQIQFIR